MAKKQQQTQAAQAVNAVFTVSNTKNAKELHKALIDAADRDSAALYAANDQQEAAAKNMRELVLYRAADLKAALKGKEVKTDDGLSEVHTVYLDEMDKVFRINDAIRAEAAKQGRTLTDKEVQAIQSNAKDLKSSAYGQRLKSNIKTIFQVSMLAKAVTIKTRDKEGKEVDKQIAAGNALQFMQEAAPSLPKLVALSQQIKKAAAPASGEPAEVRKIKTATLLGNLDKLTGRIDVKDLPRVLDWFTAQAAAYALPANRPAFKAATHAFRDAMMQSQVEQKQDGNVHALTGRKAAASGKKGRKAA